MKVSSLAEARRALGQLVEVEGLARDAKLGARVEVADLGVYLLERASWPRALVDQRVVVSGVLEETDELAAEVDADGAVSAGTSGADLVIRTASVRRG